MIEEAIRDNVKAIVKAYSRATKLPIRTISKKFYGKSTFLADFFAAEHSLSVETLEKMLQKFAAEWPDNAEWPTCRAIIIPRPSRKFVPRKDRAAA